MAKSDVQIPVRCPECGTVALTAFPILVVVTALTSWQQMRLYSSCHETGWDATQLEIQSMREHLGENWLQSNVHERTVANRPNVRLRRSGSLANSSRGFS
jgi:hypothetical protein